ncbi:MAG: hypothetical protein FWF84_03255 [Kiritimatiellaeota bacterium]|nr:hypothetical protein [Kiritimatiellota bacterium]
MKAKSVWAAVMVAVACGEVARAMAGTPSNVPLASFTLTEYLGAAWSNECVTFAVDAATAKRLGNGAVCVDGEGVEAPWQLSADGKGVRFIAALAPFGQSVYSFVSGKPSVKTALAASETKEYVEIANALTGVRISTSLNDGQGPIAAWRLSDGSWAGGSTFTAERKVESYRAFFVEKGAVLVKVEAVATFEGGGEWKLTAELQEGEPSFKIRETFDCVPSAGAFALRFEKGFDPAWILYRSGGAFDLRDGRTSLGELTTLPLSYTPERDASLKFLLQPWVWWQGSMARGNFFTLMNLDKNAAVTMMASDPKAWVDPSIPGEERAEGSVWLRKSEEGAVSVGFSVKRGEREYVLSVLPADVVRADVWGVAIDEIPPVDESHAVANLMPTKDVDWNHSHRAPISQAFAMRLAHCPLNRIKEMVLEWPESDAGSTRPRMFVSEEDIAAFRAQITEADQGWIGTGFSAPVDVYQMDFVLPAYVATMNEALGEKLYTEIPKMVAPYVDGLLNLSGDNVCWGVAPHHRSGLASVAYAMDVWLGLPQVTPEDRRSLKGQLAFLAYVMASEDYFSPERGYAGMFLNMRATVAINQLTLGAVLADHPLTPKWTEMGFAFIKGNIIDTWKDENGNFTGRSIEAPHYGLIPYDNALAAMRLRDRLGFETDLNDPTVKTAGSWFAKGASTPRDPRFMNRRHLNPIGNTYAFEPSGIFGTMAAVYRKLDPAFSAQMQWMDNEHGNHLYPGVGGFYAAFAGNRRTLFDKTLPATVPDWGSEWFAEKGVVLRSRFATESENYLYFIAGAGAKSHNHYDQDQGGITAWLRGVPLVDDFGYYACAPEEDNSMLTSPAVNGRTMEIAGLTVTPGYDAVRGTKGDWTREITLVKHADDTPDFFVIRDTLANAADATWRLWLTPEDGVVTLADNGATMKSHNGHTTRVLFAQKPADAAVTTEAKTREGAGMDSNGQYQGKRATTHQGLIVTAPAFDTLLTVIVTLKDGEAEPAVSLDGDTLTVGTDTLRLTPDSITLTR